MTSSLSGWVERPQLLRQHSSDKVLHGNLASSFSSATSTTSASLQSRPASAEAVKKAYRCALSDFPEAHSRFCTSRVGSLPASLSSAFFAASGGSCKPASGPLTANHRAASLTLPSLHVAAPPEALNGKLSVLAEPPAARGAGGYVGDFALPAVSVAARMSSRPSSAESRKQHQPDLTATGLEPAAAAALKPSARAQSVQPDACPPFGCKGTCGQRSQMQDSHTVVANFAHLQVSQQLASLNQWPETLSPPVDVPNGTCSDPMDEDSLCAPQTEAYHFFGVYDGHGGTSASHLCAHKLHNRILESMGGKSGYEYNRKIPTNEPRIEEEGESVEMVGERAEGQGGNFVPEPMSVQRLENALQDAFRRMDEDVAANQAGMGSEEYAGSTAVTAMVSKTQILLANCGDSRAVLLRGGKAIQLTSDQTAAREDEVARITGTGGEIYYLQDCARVMGVLAMSRSIGDNYLHPYVIPNPEATVIPRHPDDEFLILATDGLWDKISNEDACEVARRCLLRAKAKGASRRAAAKCAATVLIRSALSKGSRDNVTAIIVDLRSNKVYESSG